MTQDRIETADEFLEHFGVKGMKWGVHKERRIENQEARNKTKAALREVKSKPVTNREEDIKAARAKLPDAQKKAANARDQAKLDRKRGVNRIDAKRPALVAAADLNRLKNQADILTPKEQSVFDSMQLGRALGDAFFNNRSDMQKIIDVERDKQRARAALANK